MDEQQVIEDARVILRQIEEDAPELSELAKELGLYLYGPIMAAGPSPSPDELKRQYAEAMETKPREFAELIGKRGEKHKGPAYKTRVFKCLEDFENCRKHGGVSANVCLALMILCIGQQLIPFTK
jgi:hypothetical protein